MEHKTIVCVLRITSDILHQPQRIVNCRMGVAR